ncbi:AP complex, mu/sigma subunit [Mycotypha africana]|uniref:AP complex, mu/sigma subunit n=1 Tax=Mycotypha africana TaxID=64632 RepID=UPI0022FFE009|nr:AP complex, mu/sigma subunit [Mycotypha africana]KAI8979291.1 AP complex, mu/sigma subunit [Mycotypha africana]
MIHFFLIVNRSCRTRFAKYYNNDNEENRSANELDIVRRCIIRKQNQTLFFPWNDSKIVYRAYASLYFIISCDSEDNEFAYLELIQTFTECLNQFFDNVTELDLVFNLEKVHMLLDEIIVKGLIMETNQERILASMNALFSNQKKR